MGPSYRLTHKDRHGHKWSNAVWWSQSIIPTGARSGKAPKHPTSPNSIHGGNLEQN
jgi:hypothetical protein